MIENLIKLKEGEALFLAIKENMLYKEKKQWEIYMKNTKTKKTVFYI